MRKRINEIPDEVMDALLAHSWPGNIRELQNFIERSVILTPGNVLCFPVARTPGRVDAEPTTLKAAERSHIRKILMQTNGAISGPNGAAARLGLKRSTLYGRMQKLAFRSRLKAPCLPQDDFVLVWERLCLSRRLRFFKR
jgi:transcriptional regulator of acetoin/glycerol metabolism